jgi:hypothetical protein
VQAKMGSAGFGLAVHRRAFIRKRMDTRSR